MRERVTNRPGDAAIRPTPERRGDDAAISSAGRVRRVLVVGAAGYIGSELVRGLLSDGYRVRALDSLERGDVSIRALYTNPDFELVRGDIRRPEPVVRAVQGVDAVVHLGGIVGERTCRRDAERALETNVAATSLLADVCRACGVRRLLFASTCEVYGSRARLVGEGAELSPESLYAESKAAAEQVVLAAASKVLSPSVFRLAETFGVSHRTRWNFGLNSFVASVFRGDEPFEGSERRSRSVIHVAEVVAVFRQALVVPPEALAGEVFNVGSEAVRFDRAGLREARHTLRLRGALMPNFDVRFSEGPRVRFQKLRSRLGVGCRVSIREGVDDLARRWEREPEDSVLNGSETPPVKEAGEARDTSSDAVRSNAWSKLRARAAAETRADG